MPDRPSSDDSSKGGRRPDLSVTQLVSSGVATVVAAVGASRLGVTGTLIGAAFMSVVSTASSVLVRHYLDRGKEQMIHLGTEWQEHPPLKAVVTRGATGDRVDWQADPDATRLDLPTLADPDQTRLDLTAVPDVTRLDAAHATLRWTPEPATTGPGPADVPGGLSTDRRWLPSWKLLAAAAAMVFVAVVGGLAAVEAVTGVAPAKLPGGGGGTSHLLPGGGGTGRTHSRTPEPSATPQQSTAEPTATPQPSRSTDQSPPAPSPSTTAPTPSPSTSTPAPTPSESVPGPDLTG